MAGGASTLKCLPPMGLNLDVDRVPIGIDTQLQAPHIQGPLESLVERIARNVRLPQDSAAQTMLMLLCRRPDQRLAWHDPQLRKSVMPDSPDDYLSPAQCNKLHAQCQDLLMRCCPDGQWTLLLSDEPSPSLQLAPGDFMVRRLWFKKPG